MLRINSEFQPYRGSVRSPLPSAVRLLFSASSRVGSVFCSFSFYGKAAEQGKATAQASLGWMFCGGQGVKQDNAKALSWFHKAAEQGSAKVQANLGIMYELGQGVKQDYAKALSWYLKAAEQGFADAQFNLGTIYSDGSGVQRDYAQAARWFRKAADQGVDGAEYNALLAEEWLHEQRRACANCGVAETAGSGTLKPCSRCKSAAYCGKECQAAH